MRILHISKYYYPYIGGVENICRYLVENMPQHDIAVVCFSTGHKDVIEDVHGIKVYRVATWINISRQALSLSYFTMLHRALKEFKPDVIHFHWANHIHLCW
jgi:rhamnosyl/mannosyltransferase